MLFANGYMWKEMFVRAVAEHTDNIDGLTAAYFLICSGFGALTFIAWAYILIKVDRYADYADYAKKRRGSGNDGKEGGDME